MAAAAILKNRKILISSQPIDQFITKFGMLMRLATLDSVSRRLLIDVHNNNDDDNDNA